MSTTLSSVFFSSSILSSSAWVKISSRTKLMRSNQFTTSAQHVYFYVAAMPSLKIIHITSCTYNVLPGWNLVPYSYFPTYFLFHEALKNKIGNYYLNFFGIHLVRVSQLNSGRCFDCVRNNIDKKFCFV